MGFLDSLRLGGADHQSDQVIRRLKVSAPPTDLKEVEWWGGGVQLKLYKTLIKLDR